RGRPRDSLASKAFSTSVLLIVLRSEWRADPRANAVTSYQIEKAVSSKVRQVLHHRCRQRKDLQTNPAAFSREAHPFDGEAPLAFVGEDKPKQRVVLRPFGVLFFASGAEHVHQFRRVTLGQCLI